MSATQQPVRIDVHAHMLPERSVVAARAGKPWHGLQFEVGPSGELILGTKPSFRFRFNARYWESAAERRRQLTRSGMDVQLVSVTAPLLGHGLDLPAAVAAAREINAELADYSAADPALLGLATLPLQDTAAAVAELDHAHALGLPGIVLRAQVDGENWDSERLFPVLQAAADARMLVLFHPDPWTGFGDLGRYRVPDVIGQSGQMTLAAAALIFGGVLDRLPELLVCLAQAGGYAPFVGGRFDQAFRLWRDSQIVTGLPSDYLRRMYFDCLTFSQPALQCMLGVVGCDRVVAGTDHPSVQELAHPAEWLGGCGLPADDVERIVGGNLSATGWGRALRSGRPTDA